ncbi:MAG: glycolate oxidase subunit GlcD, partial [Nitrospirae bacterium]|nr:glycolate oxidase subunit GlcD [Nitrospirota bacterium]
ARKALSQSLYKLKPSKINEDIVVPRSQISRMVAGLNELSQKYQLIIVSFGHAGEGNLHVNIMTDQKNKTEWDNARRAVKEIFELTIRLGGSLSGEHGIGLAKSPYLSLEMSKSSIKLLKNIKRTFDPNGILNPGKIFGRA